MSQRTDPMPSVLERARAGDVQAMEKLLAHTRPLVYRWALTRLADPDDADDVTQKVLVKIQSRISSFRGESKWTTWLYRATANECVDFGRGQRSRSRLREQFAHLALRRTSTFESDPNDVVAWVTGLLRDVPAMQRQAVDLVDLQGFSPADAAQMLDCNPNTFRVHLHRGRERLRAGIQEGRWGETGVPTREEG